MFTRRMVKRGEMVKTVKWWTEGGGAFVPRCGGP